MAEPFLTYTEVDPGSKITVVDSKVSWASLGHNQVAYVARDMGASYFDGDFIHYLTVLVSGGANGGKINHWAIANDLDGHIPIDTANGSLLSLYTLKVNTPSPLWRMQLAEVDSGNEYASGVYGFSLSTAYYLKITRDESVGTYGTLYCYVYSDEARTTLLSTLSIALHTSKKDFRYIYACQTHNNGIYGADENLSGYTENLSFDPTENPLINSLPVVTIQPFTTYGATTVTGNGTIDSIGIAAVTAHGHCWNTTGDPTTADSKVDNGAGSLGAFTSAITGLTAGTRYYVRAYATNTSGTAYSSGLSFIAGNPTSSMPTGNLAVVGERLHYIGYDGKEYYLQGTAV